LEDAGGVVIERFKGAKMRCNAVTKKRFMPSGGDYASTSDDDNAKRLMW